ncbi:MAG TPA: protein kinase, partial [Ktedonobacterales bacterium]
MAGLEGTNVGPYEIRALLGAGGMGQVYRAHDPRLERDVAIKVLSASLAQEPGYLERFRREARAVAKLNHPNIVQVYDFGEQGDLTYLVMPLISGGTLREYLAHRQVLPLAEALSITEQMANALQYAHEQGLVHRDVKPANILMTSEGRALLSDFGIVRLVQKDDNAATLTHLGAFVGSPEYAAPEMIVGKPVDRRVDVYALGVILFQMLTGRMPFAGATPVVLMMMQAQQPPPPPRSINPDIPPAVEAVILKALAKESGERFQTAAELLAALRAAIAGPSAGAGYTQASLPGGISDLPTILSPSAPPVPGSGPAVYAPPGPGHVPPSVWIGPTSGPAGWPAPGRAPAGWAPPASGPSGWANPGSGPSGWAASGSGPAAPPLAPTFGTGLAALP